MKILIIGGTGTLGRCLLENLKHGHELLIAGRNSGDVQIDLSDEQSVQTGLSNLDELGAIVCCAGEAKWASFEDLSYEDYFVGIRSKLMGQVNVVRYGLQKLMKGGSISLTTGILADDPVTGTASAAMVNGALHSFVQAVNLELTDEKRVNVICPGLVEDSVDKYFDYFPGHNPVPMHKVVNAYRKSIFGKISGQIIRIYE